MSITWVILFPLGAAFIRLLNNRLPNPLALHRGLQGANTVLAIIGLVLGVSIGDEYVNVILLSLSSSTFKKNLIH
jgi:uncharacterized membrane-anchored protein YhcB (DUF1043 family)